MKKSMILIGNFLFRYRNKLFPFIILALFAIAIPPAELFGNSALAHFKETIGIGLALAGLAVRGVVIGFAYIKRGGLNKKVYAENLVTQGMFSLCRNPLYFGNMLIYAGVFVMHGDPLVIVAGISLYMFIYQCIIYAEENYLQNKFGDAYADYCKDVPRWIPRITQFRQARAGMYFNWRRIFLKDYSTFASTAVTLCLVEIYEHFGTALAGHWLHIGFLVLAMALVGITAAGISTLKRHRILTDKSLVSAQ
jgi:protein-S-isoprenylcysteine O-methyltransferase Ste14